MFVTSRTLITAMLGIAASALTESTAPPVEEPDMSLTACDKLNYLDITHELDSHGFVQTLKECNEESERNKSVLDDVTSVLLAVYNAVKGRPCNLTEELEKKLMDCVNNVIGFQPPFMFTPAEAKQHFGYNNTQTLQFKEQECLYSEEVRKCVEEKLSTEQSGCKDSIMSGFNVTAGICLNNTVPGELGDRSSGIRSSPLNILVLSTAIMLIIFV